METANLFQLKNHTLVITYSASGIDGNPHLSYHRGNTQLNFSGNQIRHEVTEIGTLISVTLKTIPDFSTKLFSLMLPQVNIPSNFSEMPVNVKALETMVKTTIGGPDLVSGQVQTYKIYSLVGKAKSVVF